MPKSGKNEISSSKNWVLKKNVFINIVENCSFYENWKNREICGENREKSGENAKIGGKGLNRETSRKSGDSGNPANE